MNFDKLLKSIVGVIMEEQIKLGYRKETIHLFYPLQSLNLMFGTECNIEEMEQLLKEFCTSMEADWGQTRISIKGDRFFLHFSPEVSEYVHEHAPKTGFLYDFIAAVSRHGVKIQDIEEIFHRYSDHVVVKKVTHGEFDYLIYFEDGDPDEYRYCLTDEGIHFIYHRFSKEDYTAFGFED
ncbi:MAG: DUF3877 family protein [Clostridiales bacterium]|nr:DUF3877 family protein [Candidatus Blautia equi]